MIRGWRYGDGPITLLVGRDAPSMIVSGITGAGKTEILKAMIAAHAHGQPAVVIDLRGSGREYSGSGAMILSGMLWASLGLIPPDAVVYIDNAEAFLATDLGTPERKAEIELLAEMPNPIVFAVQSIKSLIGGNIRRPTMTRIHRMLATKAGEARSNELYLLDMSTSCYAADNRYRGAAYAPPGETWFKNTVLSGPDAIPAGERPWGLFGCRQASS